MRISTADWGDLLTARPGNGNVSDDGERGRRRMNTQQPTRNAQRSSNDNDKRQRHGDHGCMIQQKVIGETETDYYMLNDLLYRAAVLTDDEGAIVETYDCDAYGNTIAYSADGVDNTWFTDDDVATNNPKCQFIFTGRRFDPETSNATTQMYFYRARYYSPTLGRFISRDPIDYAGGMNLYEYVGGGVAGRLDPPGLWYLDGDTAVMVRGDTLWSLSRIMFGKGSMYGKFGYTESDTRKMQIGTRVDLSSWLAPLRGDIKVFVQMLKTMSVMAKGIQEHCCNDDKEAKAYLDDYSKRMKAAAKRLRDKSNPIWELLFSSGSPLVSFGLGAPPVIHWAAKWFTEFGINVILKTPGNLITGVGIGVDIFQAVVKAKTEPKIASGHAIMAGAATASCFIPVMIIPTAVVATGKGIFEYNLRCEAEKDTEKLCAQVKRFYNQLLQQIDQRQKASEIAEAKLAQMLKGFGPPPSR